MSSILQRKLPAWLFQTRCNAVLFDRNCKLARADHMATGEVVWTADLLNSGRTLRFLEGTGWKGPDEPSEWPNSFFRFGFLVMDGRDPDGDPVDGLLPGRVPILRQIRDSQSLSGGSALDLAEPLDAARLVAGTYRIFVFPGCSGRAGASDEMHTCKWYDNFTNFGGYPHIPDFMPQRQLGGPKK